MQLTAIAQGTNTNSIALYSSGSGNALHFDGCLFVASTAGSGGNGCAGSDGGAAGAGGFREGTTDQAPNGVAGITGDTN